MFSDLIASEIFILLPSGDNFGSNHNPLALERESI